MYVSTFSGRSHFRANASQIGLTFLDYCHCVPLFLEIETRNGRSVFTSAAERSKFGLTK